MAKRILDLGHAPPEEVAAMTDALEAASIPHYMTAPGLFGLESGGLWIVHDSDESRARAVIDAAQAAYLAARRDRAAAQSDRRWRRPAASSVFALLLLAAFLYLLWSSLRAGL